ncbi:cytoplasmic dynein 1 heavy chain 1-like isoform X2 [Dysidea avara]|uniref:cytoplasmic dynein 1 heavy chain 1-like isoform X2 n=1 Tax=Dysidea avara TaxID=196820 RepID=UPI003326492A
MAQRTTSSDTVVGLPQYVLNTCCSLFGNDEVRNISLLKDVVTSHEDLLNKFAADQNEVSLTVNKVQSNKGEVSYDVKLGVGYRQTDSSSSMHVVFIKRVVVVTADKTIPSQFLVMNLTDYSLEHMYLLLKDMVNPLFNYYTKQFHREGDKYLSSVQQKITELEVSLLHLQQNTDIPDVQWKFHPAISAVVQKAAEENRKPTVKDFGSQVSDSSFLNHLQKSVGCWIVEIKKVTQLQLDRKPPSGSALQEINFWINLGDALDRIQSKCNGEEVQLTLDVLKAGRRFLAAVSFDADTGLKEATEKVKSYNHLMKEFPLNNLLAARDLTAITSSVVIIFSHLRKVRNSLYPVSRAIALVAGALSGDVNNQLLKILRAYKLMTIPYNKFKQVMDQCTQMFTTWDEQYDKFNMQLRDIGKKKKEAVKPNYYATCMHMRLQERLSALEHFREQYEILQRMITHLLPAHDQLPLTTTDSSDKVMSSEVRAVTLLHSAYSKIEIVDYLDVIPGPEGTTTWDTAMKSCDDCFNQVESMIADQLREKLSITKTVHSMFSTLLHFKSLFMWPHVRGVIAEHRWKLLQKVRDEIKIIHQKVKMGYADSSASQMSPVYDIPPVVGCVMWMRQIERKLKSYQRKITEVLGEEWDMQGEGQSLKEEIDVIKRKLNSQGQYEEWKRLKTETLSCHLVVEGTVIILCNSRRDCDLKFKINYSQEIVNLLKEVRAFNLMELRTPLLLVSRVRHCKQLYPVAVCVNESISTYQLTCDKIAEIPTIASVVADSKLECQNLLLEGVETTWESFLLDNYAKKLSNCINAFQRKTDQLIAEGGYSCSSKTLVNKEINSTGVVLQDKSNESPQAKCQVVEPVEAKHQVVKPMEDGTKENAHVEKKETRPSNENVLADFFAQLLMKKPANSPKKATQAQPLEKKKSTSEPGIDEATSDIGETTSDTGKTATDTGKVTSDTAKVTSDTGKATSDTSRATSNIGKATSDTSKATTDTGKATSNVELQLTVRRLSTENAGLVEVKNYLMRHNSKLRESMESLQDELSQAQMKAKEKDKIIKQMEDDKKDLVVKLEAITKETKKAKQALENEDQKSLEQMNTMAKEKDELIKQMENDKKELTATLEAKIQETDMHSY